ncbi:transmembrane protein 236 [Chanos chanos]|uniref:Transmembrane protein 236 n=1 Tax=Chanos chanos TaxID=29144 RepID=A0A6J2VKP2_CHACN|nr:transmembrane protein 236 [Chanos chanos]
MVSGKIIKLILYELLEFACLSVPVFVVMERFASLMRCLKSDNHTTYWLVVAASIAYVTTVTLFFWVPVKYLTLKTNRFSEVIHWRPVTLAYIILSTLPCFGFIIASSKVQVNQDVCSDTFTELPVSLVLFCLICVDIVERIRPLRLTGPADGLRSYDVPGPTLTHLEQVSTVSVQVQSGDGGNGSPVRNGSARFSSTHTSNATYFNSYHSYSGPFAFLWVSEPRHQAFVDAFLFWFDMVEMVRVAGITEVYYSGWIFPIYILAYLSALRVIVTPNSALLSTLGVLSQDLPFLVVRVCLIVVFGYVTPVLYVLKNLLACLTFVYFVFMTKLRFFNRGSLF